jgi:DNA gyrase subunit A
MVPNFDGNELEVDILPTRIPLILINGATGIAVGMSTNIPPHNLKEVMSRLIEIQI